MGRLDKLLHQGDWEAAFAFADQLPSAADQADALHRLARGLRRAQARPDFPSLLDRVVAVARGNEVDQFRVSGLCALVQELAPLGLADRSRCLLTAALELAAEIWDDDERASAVMHLTYLLDRTAADAEALDHDTGLARLAAVARTLVGRPRQERLEHLARVAEASGRGSVAEDLRRSVNQEPEPLPPTARRRRRPTVDPELMRALAAGSPMTAEALRGALAAHAEFLAVNDRRGVWHTFAAGGTVIGVFTGGAEGASGQAALSHQRLEGVDLRGVVLACADLVGVHCVGQDLGGADLEGALCTDADFSGSDFTGANLARADFSRSCLAGCVLRDADLSGTDFQDADLSGAELEGALTTGARFKDTALDGARGLPHHLRHDRS